MGLFNPARFAKEAVSAIEKQVQGRAIIAASGGVDSMAATVLATQALGEQLLAVHVDTGYMRQDESTAVGRMLVDMKVNHHVVDASDRFYAALEGVTDPELKRTRIGELFIRVFEEEARGFDAKWLVQGTIAPDWIESGGGLRDTIKSHHNVGGLPEDMEIELCEPLRELYKDEVRALAEHLGVAVAQRQPFPGPGLAVRVMGEATRERIALVRQACYIVEQELEAAAEAGEMELPWQYFAVLLPVRTVGVQGDVRAYGHTIAVRAVQSFDAMTAQASAMPWAVQQRISRRITNKLKADVNRVVYDITDKPPGTIEWE